MQDQPMVLIVDNGSLRTDSYIQLVNVAEQLQSLIHTKTVARPLQHIEKIPKDEWDGEPVPAFTTAMQQWIKRGITDFVILPFFFGPSRAITGLLMEYLGDLKRDFPSLTIHVGNFLCDPAEPVYSISQMLADSVTTCIKQSHLSGKPDVIVVDHGSPLKAIADIRNRIGDEVNTLLGDNVTSLQVASMERRPGDNYAFNEPLLESVLQKRTSTAPLIIAKQFLLPGRHAGAGGDVDQIVEKHLPLNSNWHSTQLLAYHPCIPYLLKERYQSVIQNPPTV